jgi:hypothetical protein
MPLYDTKHRKKNPKRRKGKSRGILPLERPCFSQLSGPPLSFLVSGYPRFSFDPIGIFSFSPGFEIGVDHQKVGVGQNDGIIIQPNRKAGSCKSSPAEEAV